MHLPPHYLQNSAKSPVLRAAFNADSSLFATAETDGWRIFDALSLTPIVVRDIPNGSLSLVYPFHRSNLVFLVGGPPAPLYAPNKVICYSLTLQKVVATIEFASNVLNLAARHDRLVVVLRHRVVLFSLNVKNETELLTKEGSYETVDNPKGLVGLSTTLGSTLLCFPGRQRGHVALVKLPALAPTTAEAGSASRGQGPGERDKGKGRMQDPPFPTTSILLAHNSSLAALATSRDGSIIVTASSKGTLIRVWDATSTTLLRELRRGSDSADIFDLAIRQDGQAVAATSDKGTIHIWLLAAPAATASATSTPEKATRSFKSLKSNDKDLIGPYLPKYFKSQWSDAQFRLPPPAPKSQNSAGLGNIFDVMLGVEEKREKVLTVEDDRVWLTWATRPTDKDGDKNGDGEVLLALTQSGSYFKIQTIRDPLDEAETRQQRKQIETAGFGAEGQCQLVQFLKFDQRDGW